jgi:uncharacterized RDD family membrane protein YckC
VSEQQQPVGARPGAEPGTGAEPAVGAEPGGAPWPVASLKRRFGALVVDWVLCLLVAGFFGPLTGSIWPSVVLVAEYAFFVGLFGQTPGMRVARIRCIPVGGPGVIGVPRAALRGLLLALVVPGLIMDRHQRGLHDRAVGSVMVAA